MNNFNNNNKNNRNSGWVRNAFLWIFVVIAAVVGIGFLVNGNNSSGVSTEKITYTELLKTIDQGNIKAIKNNEGKEVKEINFQPEDALYVIKGTYEKPKESKTSSNFPLLPASSQKIEGFTAYVIPTDTNITALQDRAEGKDINVKVTQQPSTGFWGSILSTLIPMLLMIGFLYLMLGGMGARGGGGAGNPMSFGKSRAKQQDGTTSKVRFADVAGSEEEKQELVEVVDFLKNPKKYHDLGARIPAGVLLEGPPGTGKTLLAKAVAGEAGVPFYSISGSDFVEMFVGVGASRVRDLFENAKKNAPAIVFIDEIDAVGRQRGAGLGGGNDEREQTLNQLLVEMDGFQTNEQAVIVVAATNRSDVLDPALLRPGRFDRKVFVAPPDVKGREAVLRVHAKNKPLADDVDLKTVAQRTPGYVGADLENVLNEAALVAARRNKKKIDSTDIDEAEDRVLAGPAKKDRNITDHEREIVAYHEAGHAVVGLVLSNARRVRKVTIVPRGRIGGYMLALPEDDIFQPTDKMLKEQLASLMGGRQGEIIVFGEMTPGASNDIEQATKIARSMVTEYGMSEKLGMVSYEGSHEVFIGRDYGQAKSYSEATAILIDEEVRKITAEAMSMAEKAIKDNLDKHKVIAEALLKYETLDERQIGALWETGKMPDTDLESGTATSEAKTYEESVALANVVDQEKEEAETLLDSEKGPDTLKDNK